MERAYPHLRDPVFNLSCRDSSIGWTSADRKERLVNILDAFVLGAVPPYNQILGGKLIACLLKSKEVQQAFTAKYGETEGIISHKQKHARLVAVTTTSSLGRSSIYNRLSIGKESFLERIGFTQGYGHFQIPSDIFEKMRDMLELEGHKYANGNKFGAGPNWKMRAIRQALGKIGLSGELLKHNLKREVFLCRIAKNADAFLRGEIATPKFSKLKSASDLAEDCKTRWMLPRALRMPEFRNWNAADTFSQTVQGNVNPELKAGEKVKNGSGA